MLRAVLFLSAALCCCSLVAVAQTAGQPDKKADAGKGKEPKTKDIGKSKTDKTIEPAKVDPKVKPPETVEELLERIKALERQLKPDKKLVSYCKLFGKLEGDFLVCRAECAFSTETPKTTVILGLQGGHLLDEGELDRQMPILEYTKEDGFIARVEKEGPHQLTLNFRVPAKKSSTGAIEKTLDLGLPGAVVTTLNLEMPANIKEVTWNGTLEKARTPGRWTIGLGESKSLNLAWKEPLAMSGVAPPAKADVQIKVDVDKTHVKIGADLFLEDGRRQTKDWYLVLPPAAKLVEVKAPAGLKYEWIEGKPYQTLRLSEATAERLQVSVSLRVPRPNPGVRVPIGPFHALGALPQKGTITVKMPAEIGLGQRLVYSRTGDINQIKNTETEAVFQYVAPPDPDKNAKAPPLKAPLELEWRLEKNQVRTKVEHLMQLKPAAKGWELEATTRIEVAALFAAVNGVDLKLPQPDPVIVWGLASVPAQPFPAGLPWTGIWKMFYMPYADASTDAVIVLDGSGKPLDVVPLDATGKVRVVLESSPAKETTLVLKRTFHIPPQGRHIRVELPRPLNTQDRGAKLSVQADPRVELLHGAEGAEEPVPDRHRFVTTWDQSPSVIELVWRPYQREIVAQGTIDIDVHEHSA